AIAEGLGRMCWVCDAATGERLCEIQPGRELIRSLAFVGDDAVATVAENGPVRIWDALSGNSIWHLPNPRIKAIRLATSADGRCIATGGDDEVQLWDSKLRKMERRLNGHKG